MSVLLYFVAGLVSLYLICVLVGIRDYLKHEDVPQEEDKKWVLKQLNEYVIISVFFNPDKSRYEEGFAPPNFMGIVHEDDIDTVVENFLRLHWKPGFDEQTGLDNRELCKITKTSIFYNPNFSHMANEDVITAFAGIDFANVIIACQNEVFNSSKHPKRQRSNVVSFSRDK